MSCRNARFWVYWNHSFVKITMSPGQSLSAYTAWSHEEGWSSESLRLEYDAEQGCIVRHWCLDGRDCDGRLTRSGTDHCSLDELASIHLEDEDVCIPHWLEGDRGCFDEFAEAAGY